MSCRYKSRLSGGAKASSLFQLEAFNSCDPITIKEELHHFLNRVKVKDHSGYYQNNDDTLVVKLNSTKDLETLVKLSLAMKSLGADEIDVKRTHTGVYMRFWWD